MIGEFMLILVINYVGILISTVLHFPLPGTITALLLLFLLLKFRVLKLEKIENAANSKMFKEQYAGIVKEYKNVVKALDSEIKRLSNVVENYQALEQLKGEE